MRSVICDIDGTLSDTSHRLHHVTNGKRDWDAFFAAMSDDPVHEPIRDAVESLGADFPVLLCSGRPETYRDVTIAWLKRHGIGYTALYMRPEGDHRADHIVKAQLLAGMREDGYEPWLAIDDRPSIVVLWRENGITCLQCRDWNERSNIEPGLLTILVGPSGAGKSFFIETKVARQQYGIHRSHVISSDQIRLDRFGTIHDMSKNDEVFGSLHAVVRARIAAGLPAVVDATNLHRRDRLSCIACCPENVKVRYLVFNRPMADKVRDGGWRNEIPGLLEKHEMRFQSALSLILGRDGLENVDVIDLRNVAL